VRKAVIAVGVDPKLIEVSSHGDKDPLIKVPPGTYEPRNRRAEVVVR
jgi:outer membrane protein OmpA-like peptidoglycan-associated protein